jgi:hypothetical protein
VIPIALVWQNVHPSVLTGALAVAAIAVADTWTTWRAGALRWPWAIAGLALLLGLVQLATPLGWAIFPIAKANLHVARDLIRTGEWLPPWDPSVLRALAPFWVAFSITVLVLPRLWRIADARDLSLLLLISVLSMSATRFVMLWALSLVPLWATWFEHAWPRGLFASWRENGRTGFSPWRCAGVGVLTVLAILLGHPARYLPIVRSEIPLAGVATLRSWLPDEARIYNDYVWAGPLLLEGKSGWRVAVDGRLYCYPDDEFWHRREAEAAGQFRLAVLEATHRMDAFVLNRAFDRVLIEEIERSRSWRLVHLGRECVMFVRADLSPHDRNRPASSGWTVLGVSPRAPRAPVPDRDRTVVSRAAWSSL